MPGDLSAERITLEDFHTVLSRYAGHVRADLKELDEFRFEELPREIESRWQMQGEMEKKGPVLLLSKDELVQLVRWKLKHGTFRPKLQQLVESNDEGTVHKITRDLSIGNRSAKEKMQMLTQLKGIGPATASLVLSCISPTQYPFFSDELFRWIHWDGKNADGSNAGIKSGSRWSRPIGYTPKEYDSLIARCEQVQERFSGDDRQLNFLDLEKVAYVLGKEKADIEANGSAEDKTAGKRTIEKVEDSGKVVETKRRKADKVSRDQTEPRSSRTRSTKR